MPADRPFWELDPSVVCGLVRELGERARATTGLKNWERDAATWRAVIEALELARAGHRPAGPVPAAPPWLARLVRDRLTGLSQHHALRAGDFETIRSLERLGLVELPVDDTYVLAAISGVGNRFAPREADALREDPELRDKVVWRMFEVEGGGEVSLANVDKYRAAQNSWQQAFLDVTADGTLPRGRVLSAALAALGRDFSAYRAGWFQRLYVSLEPTVDEDADRQPQLRGLLGSGVSATGTFAVTRLKALSEARRLDDEATVPALSPALLSPVKGTAVAAVRLLSDIVRRTPGLRSEVVEVAGTGLGHPHADVQKAAADLLLRVGAHEVVRAAADDLAPTVRIAVVPDAAQPELHDDVLPPVPEPLVVRAVRPGDVVERLAALLEDPADPLEVELVLAGVAGLADPAVLHPLRKRARTILDRGPHEMSHPGWLRGRLAAIVPAVLGEPIPALESRRATDAFLGQRVAEVARSARAGARQPLLATPDTASGWLYPETLVRRLQDLRHVVGTRDVVAALLRLHPDGREEARRALEAGLPLLPEELLRPVFYALGGEPPGDLGASPAAWWIAASRSRTPLAHDPWLTARGLTGAGRSAPIVAQLQYTSQTSRHESFHGRAETHTWWSWALEVDDGVRGTDETPTATRSRKGWEEFGGLDETVGWLALTWPHDAEHFLVDGAPTVVEAATQHEVRHDAVRVLDALLGHEGRIGPLAGATIAAGLSAGKPDQRARAVDLALHLTAQGRLTGPAFGDALAGFAGPATPSRCARSLADLAAASRTGRRLVIEALPTALAATDPQRRGLHELLELLHGELLREQAPTPPVLVPWLSRLSGSSRAATAARALLLGR